MSNKNFQTDENEILSRDDEKICQMLGDLKRVDAPKDFDFRLKARIANAKPQDFVQPRLFPILRYIAPLALAIIVLAVVVINGLYSVDKDSVATVIENFDKPAVENKISPDNSQPVEQFVADANLPTVNMGNLTATVVNKDKNEIRPFSKDLELANTNKPKSDEPKAEDKVGGSRDDALKKPSIFLPDGFGANNTFSVKDVLSIIGIKASFLNEKWKVESVAQNSQAERSGIKSNDVIEAIDDNKLSTEMINSKGAFNGKKLTVVRGGEKIEINLQNK